jgi:prepilin-type N-terminal cleavage/methylation domain-containing protein
MKRSPSRSRSFRLSSFTLVEMLVVIAIIAILAAVLLSAGGSAIRAALRAKAFNTATQIQTATINFYTEYSLYPVPGGTTADYTITDASSSATTWGNLIEALCGNIKPSTGAAATQTSITNSHAIAFLTMKSADVDSSDAPKNPLPTSTTANVYFNIAMDSDYDGILGVSPSAVTTLPNFGATTFSSTGGGSTTAGVAVWANCNGPTGTHANFWVHTY